MKLRADQLNGHLAKDLASCYLVTGDEPLLQMEACDHIRQAARQQGFEERMLFHAEAGFNWADVRDEADAMSLFANRRILEIRVPNGKPSDKGDTLKHLAASGNPDNLVLIVCPRLDSKAQKTAWFKALEKHGAVVQIWPIDRPQYPAWIKHRLQQANIQADPAAVNMLAQHTEGNLLAASQEIEKLRISGVTRITEEQVNAALGDSARYDAFGYADACLTGNIAAASRMLSHLKAEGVEVLSILGALTHKIRQLLSLTGKSGQELNEAFSQARIWPRQQTTYKKALEHLDEARLLNALQQAEKVDAAAKGMGGDPWLILEELTVLLTSVKLYRNATVRRS